MRARSTLTVLVLLLLGGCATGQPYKTPRAWELRGVVADVEEGRLLLKRGEGDELLVPLGPDTPVVRESKIVGLEALEEGDAVLVVYGVEPDPAVPPERIDLLQGEEARKVRDRVYGEQVRDPSDGILAPETSPAPEPSPPGFPP